MAESHGPGGGLGDGAAIQGASGSSDHAVMIDVRELSRFYGAVPAVQDVTFQARRGEILGFLGPNGAGKTTSMRIITGYMPPTSGDVSVAGHDVVNASMEARRAIGYLPENTPLYLDMTVREYLEYMARLRDVADLASAAERAMEMTAVSDREDNLIGQLSKGYRQRVGIAQALVHDPAVIILDEPTIGLDPRQIREVRGLIQELRGEHTVLLSTHILPEAQEVCDRVLIISNGRLVAEDTPSQLTARLSGGQRMRLRLAEEVDPAAATEVLGAVDGVQAVEATGRGRFFITSAPATMPQPDLANAVVGRGWPLLEMTPVGMTLEEIFLELTDEDDLGDDATVEEGTDE